jgi:hypothetical protein
MTTGYTNPVCKGDKQLGTACGHCDRCIISAIGTASSAPINNVTRLRHALPMSQDINAAISDLDKAIADAVDAAKAAGLPQGLIVGLLHGHAHAQTHQMVMQ